MLYKKRCFSNTYVTSGAIRTAAVNESQYHHFNNSCQLCTTVLVQSHFAETFVSDKKIHIATNTAHFTIKRQELIICNMSFGAHGVDPVGVHDIDSRYKRGALYLMCCRMCRKVGTSLSTSMLHQHCSRGGTWHYESSRRLASGPTSADNSFANKSLSD